MKIVLAGYGKMGHELEKTALSRGHSIIAIYQNKEDWDKSPIPACDVVLEFTSPSTAPDIINYCFQNGFPVVSGTTGWNDKLETLKEQAIKEGRTFFYSSNFSIGVNIFFQLNRKLASLLCPMNDYNVQINEIHHIHKKDAPSGTAITLAEGISSVCDRYNTMDVNEVVNKKITITSERVGEIPGTHNVEWKSDVDSINIVHTAFSRKGFALGAIIAAEWLQGKTGVFNMDDLLNEAMKK